MMSILVYSDLNRELVVVVVEHHTLNPGFDPHWRHCVVSLSKAHYFPTVLVHTQEMMALY